MESKFQIINNLRLLPNAELVEIQDFLKLHLDGHIENFETRTSDTKTSKCIDIYCPHCNSSKVKKNGHKANKSGFMSQRFLCKDCGKTFNNRTKTITSSAKISFEQYQKIIECFANHLTLKRTADICSFSTKTAHLWRIRLTTLQKLPVVIHYT